MKTRNKIRLFTPEQAIKNKAQFVAEMISLLEYGIQKIHPYAKTCLCHSAAILTTQYNEDYDSRKIAKLLSQIGISRESVKMLSAEDYEALYETFWFNKFGAEPRINYLKKVLRTYENSDLKK